MSIILITDHKENIYDIFKTQQEAHKQFRSKFKTAGRVIRTDYFVPKKKFGVMGVAEMEPPDPHNYLRKRTGQPCYVKIYQKEPRIPGRQFQIPRTKDLMQISKPEKSDVNFVEENIKKMKNQPAKEPEPKMVLDVHGSKEKLLPAYETKYVHLPYFGKTPQYLKRFKEQREKEYQVKKDTTGVAQPLCQYVTRDKREELLSGLKQNWEELQQHYQGLPILTDTLPKILRKSKMEAELKQLERDIVLLERHPYIYIYEDDEIP